MVTAARDREVTAIEVAADDRGAAIEHEARMEHAKEEAEHAG